eukprot:TRINITY_DN15476_c0_g1_i1.p1 TRINITY_DN15476_c0_g1~~TRINITY_DN15476_c0_g1_i1.p1  ORF type:complete len:479 (+),score=62.74 TRINITY_DN15476_c0_g1_i1:75-1511(+)
MKLAIWEEKSRWARVDCTIPLLCSVCFIEGADLQLLPATFKALERQLGLSPADLATLGACQSVVQFMSGVFWGAFVDAGWSRKWLLVGGASSWGFLTLLLAYVTYFPSMLFLRMLNGAALGVLQPVAQSILADTAEPSERGFFFGCFQLALNVGVLTSAIFAASISNMTLWGFNGWRVAFVCVALASFAIAAMLALLMMEPERMRNSSQKLLLSTELAKCRRYLRIPTFKVIVLQGTFGSIPWSALSFAVLFFQNCGISDFHSSMLYASAVAGTAIGGVLGGCIGDRLARWSPAHGRPLTAQISVAAGIPLIALVLAGVPRNAHSYGTFMWLMLAFGLVSSWCSAGVNRPILAEIVGIEDRASIFAWLVAMDGAFAAVFGAPVVGVLADSAFGYEPSRLSVAEMAPLQRETNASSLAAAMLCCTVGPWILCFALYSLLHVTYGSDLPTDVAGSRPAGASIEATPLRSDVAKDVRQAKL